MFPLLLVRLRRLARVGLACSAFVPWMVGGLLPLETPLAERWPWAGAWRMPVGDARRLGVPGPEGEPAYALLRGVQAADSTRRAHDGADLGNRRAGGPVVAAAHGVVIRVETRPVGGYGCHVVLAHRDPHGRLAYSVYSHLAEGSIAVREGEVAWSGQPLGRVGRTGRATTPHLHFEVRIPDRRDTRWERARAVPPHVYVTNRLAVASAGADPALAWAEAAGLIPRERHDPAAPLERSTWHAMLAAAARHLGERVPREAAARVRTLDACGVIAARGSATFDWNEVEADVKRLAARGHRLPPAPPRAAAPRPDRPTVAGALAALMNLATEPSVAASPDPSGR